MRLDLDNLQTTRKLWDAGVDWSSLREHNSSVDICRCCHNEWEFEDDVSHPPYSDRSIIFYRCAICYNSLSDDDN